MQLEALAAITERQHGLATTAQVLSSGGTHSWLKWAVEDGRLECKRRGVYRVVGSADSPYVDIAAAVLAGGAGVAAADFAAGWLWDARDVAPAPPELIAFDGRQVRIKGVRVRRSRLAANDWITERHGIATVTAPLMIAQIAKATSAELGISIARDLRKRGLVGYLRILECIDATGIKVPVALPRYCERALQVVGHDDSPAAAELGVAMLEAGLPEFVTQFQVVVDGRVCLFDFAWPERMVGLEYLGREDHGPDQLDRDARRRTALTAIGWRILDVTKAMSHTEVIRWVQVALATRVQ
jgi:very-short-patch-repair endonuclease